MKQIRKRVLVLNRFQKWFVANFLIYTALFLAVLGFGLFAWFKLLAQELLAMASLLSQTFIDVIDRNITYGLIFTGVLVGILLILAAWQSLMFSRRIAGPLFAFARHLENCKRTGKLTHLTLRKDDLFCDLAGTFNELADRINEHKGAK